MSGLNWERQRKERLCQAHGTEGVGVIHTSPSGYPRVDSPDHRGTRQDSRRGKVAEQTDPNGKRATGSVSSSLTMKFRILDSITRKAAEMEELSGDELKECLEICHVVVKRIEQLLPEQAVRKAPLRKR